MTLRFGLLEFYVNKKSRQFVRFKTFLKLFSSEKACYISVIGKDDANEEQQREYMLPDGEKIMIGNAKNKAPEILFNPERKFFH